MDMVNWENYKTQTVKHEYRVEVDLFTDNSVHREDYTTTAESVSEALKKVAMLYDDSEPSQNVKELIVRVRGADAPSEPLYCHVIAFPPKLSHALRWVAVCAAYNEFQNEEV